MTQAETRLHQTHRWSTAAMPLALAIMSAARCDAAPSTARLPGYPKLAMYSSMHGDGRPYVKSDGAVDTAAVLMQSKWDTVTLDVQGAITHPQVIALLRQFNPAIKVLGFVLGHDYFVSVYDAAARADTIRANYPWHYWQAVRNTNGVLRDTLGHPYAVDLANVNLANRDSAGNFVTALAIADTTTTDAIRSGLFDGLFVDVNCTDVAGPGLDYRRAGHASLTAFKAGWKAGHRALAERLRAMSPPGFLLVGNCGPSAEYDVWNGWMRENFPLQDGGSWESNMVRYVWGGGAYLSDDTTYVKPTMCWLSTMAHVSYRDAIPRATDPINGRKARFVLGSATLAGGVATIVWTAGDPLRGYTPMWYDEYAVDTSGRASAAAEWKGWLGQPQGPARPIDAGLWRRDFDHGIVIVNPNPLPASVALGGTYRLISGAAEPDVNTGAFVNQVTVGANDALFLLSAAVTAPPGAAK
jgi:hypothetical protein